MDVVPYDALEPSDDLLVLEYQGMPFTGLAEEHDEAGARVAETSYVDGQRSGPARTWSPTGQLLSEEHFLLNALHGPARAWFEDGQLESEATYELGICTAKQAWTPLGEPVASYRLAETDPQYRTLQRLREVYLRPQS